ncbi:hypothetical protein AB0J90_18210 [Micromonospora sp. NPDC049523]|uniref:hypothetical protein n=1 Tax=Micromonospora sp. NPDC049523 TaxID=3155921 RepID=UPI0034455B5B
MTVLSGRARSVRPFRWLMVIVALFSVTLFGGSSCVDGPLASPVAGYGACPNVILQASLQGALAAEAGGEGPDGRHGEVVAGACLVVMALAGLALIGAIRRPLLMGLAYWWAQLPFPTMRPPAGISTRLDALRI